LAGDNPEIQLADVDASQRHSGSVVTLNAPVPPAASISDGVVTVTWHAAALGAFVAVEMLEEFSQPPATRAARTRAAASARILSCTVVQAEQEPFRTAGS
jgi:hypothetical protein